MNPVAMMIINPWKEMDQVWEPVINPFPNDKFTLLKIERVSRQQF